MDCDLSHDPEYLPALVNAAAAGQDLVIGSRYMNGGVSVVNWPMQPDPAQRVRATATSASSRVSRPATAPAATAAGAAKRWRGCRIAAMVSDGYAFLVEMLFEAKRRGCRIGEVPIIFVERRLGHSKLSSNVLIESLIMPWRLIFRRRRHLTCATSS